MRWWRTEYQENTAIRQTMEKQEVNVTKVDINKVKSVIDQEFDTEILYKHRDLSAIENEIGKAEAQLTVLKKYYEGKEKAGNSAGKKAKRKSANESQDSTEPTEYSKKYTQLLSFLNAGGDNMILPKKRKQETVYSPVSSGYMQTRSQSSSLRPVARMRPSTNSVECQYQQQNKCICRRSDNVLVSLACPKCGKTDFLSPQGFINHCRIAHTIDILSHDHAAMTCGTLLPKAEQDDNGLEALENLEKHGLDPSVNLNKPDLAEYAKTNKRDPLASMNVEKFGISNDIKKRKHSEALSPTASDLKCSPSTATPVPSVKPVAKQPKPSFSHLKNLFGDQVANFDGLVSSATEDVPNTDLNISDDDSDDLKEESVQGKHARTAKEPKRETAKEFRETTTDDNEIRDKNVISNKNEVKLKKEGVEKPKRERVYPTRRNTTI